MTSEEPRFDDDEVREVFARAAARQEERRDAAAEETASPAAGESLSLSELVEIGAQAGIRPGHVERAAAEVARRRREVPGSGRSALSAARRIPTPKEGLSEEDLEEAWERIVRELRETHSRHGSVSRFGAVREWHSGGEGKAPVTVRLAPAGGELRLTLRREVASRRKQPLIAGGVLGLVALLLGALFLVGDFATPVGRFLQLLLAGALAVGGGGVLLERAWERREAKRLEELADRVALLLREGAD